MRISDENPSIHGHIRSGLHRQLEWTSPGGTKRAARNAGREGGEIRRLPSWQIISVRIFGGLFGEIFCELM